MGDVAVTFAPVLLSTRPIRTAVGFPANVKGYYVTPLEQVSKSGRSPESRNYLLRYAA